MFYILAFCTPYGNRIRISALKGLRPKPLDEGSIFFVGGEGFEPPNS